MTDYRQGKIYYIKNEVSEKIYIGSTVHTLQKRFKQHMYHFNRYTFNGSKYFFKHMYPCSSFQILTHPSANIFLLQEVPSYSKNELLLKEAEWIAKSQHAVNKQIPKKLQTHSLQQTREEFIEGAQTD